MNLPLLIQSFVLHFGEMGSHWGINRTVGQIYALLFVAERPLNAEELVEQLGISRSNISIGLKELQSWRLVRLTHLPGDRREYFSAPEDVFAIFKTLAEERQRREVEPTLTMLRGAMLETPATPAERHAQARMRQMHELIELLVHWFEDVRKLSPETLRTLLKLGSSVTRLLEFKERITGQAARAKRDASNSAIDPPDAAPESAETPPPAATVPLAIFNR
jgi:DNA-binding transcriptional regulator GbsR (MarR family)